MENIETRKINHISYRKTRSIREKRTDRGIAIYIKTKQARINAIAACQNKGRITKSYCRPKAGGPGETAKKKHEAVSLP
jgi:hypothetical protein